MKTMNHGLQTLCENFLKKLYSNATMSTTDGGCSSLDVPGLLIFGLLILDSMNLLTNNIWDIEQNIFLLFSFVVCGHGDQTPDSDIKILKQHG